MKNIKLISQIFLSSLVLAFVIIACSDSDDNNKVEPKIEIQESVIATAKPSREVVEFTSTYPWYAEALDSWIQLSKYRGQALKRDSLVFTCDENPEMEERQGWIEIRLMDQMIHKLKVVQLGRGTLITLPKNMVYFSKQGGEAIIDVITHLDWEPEVASKDGFTFTKIGEKQLKVTAPANSSGADKELSVKIVDKGKTVEATLNIIQKDSDHILFISLDEEGKDPLIKKDATSIEIPATLNIDYECILSHDWITLNSTTVEEGANFKEVNITVDVKANDTGAERDGYVVIKGTGVNATASDTLFVSQMGKGKRIYVKAGASGDGSSWELAFGSMHEAMAASGHDVDHEIWVAAGSYQFARTLTWSGVNVYGGFIGGERKFKQRDLKNKPIFLGGKFQFMNAWNPPSNKLYWMDGVIFSDCENMGDVGVGAFEIYQRGFRNCVFRNIRYGKAAGGYYSNCTLVNCLYYNLYAPNLLVRASNSRLYNVTIVNSSSGSGSPQNTNYFESGSKVYNSIFWGNTAGDGTKDVQVNLQPNTTTDFINCAIMGGFNIQGLNNVDGVALDKNNDSANGPHFVNPTGSNPDFSLKSTSPCINKGNSSMNNAPTDILGNPRIIGASIDIGAYEFVE